MIQGAKLALYENYTFDYRRRIHRFHQLNTRSPDKSKFNCVSCNNEI